MTMQSGRAARIVKYGKCRTSPHPATAYFRVEGFTNMEQPDPLSTARAWRVVIKDNEGSGREGSMSYHDAGGRLDFFWELAGGNTVASVNVGTEAQWRLCQPWALASRAQILQRVAAEAIRQKLPAGCAEIDDQAGWIHLRASGAQAAALRVPPQSPSPQLAVTAAPFTGVRGRMGRLSVGIAAALLFAAAAAIGLKGLFNIKSPHGTPLGPSVRTPQHIATIISTLESYVPSLHHNPDEDRHSLSLFLVPVDGRSTGQVIDLGKGWRSRDLHTVRLLGGDGKTVWFVAKGIGGANVETHKLLGSAELRRANPSLDELWDDYRRIEFEQRLRVTSPDRQRVYEIEPESLKAAVAQASRGFGKSPFAPDPQDFLSVGTHSSPTEWLALLSDKEAQVEYRPKSRLSPLNRAESAKEMRRFHRAQLGPEESRGMREIRSLSQVSGEQYFNAAFVRSAPSRETIRINGPESFLMAYTAKPGLGASLIVARVDVNGKLLWRADTGIDRFKLTQIMPGSPSVAFIGTRPPVPGVVSEPILVVVDNETGVLRITSLWK